MKNKKGQITISIILALIIVVTILLIVLLNKGGEIQVVDEENPQAYIESCSEEAVQEAIDILSANGGDINPKNTVMFNGENITYLCYTNKDFERCIVEEPTLIMHIENEISKYIGPEVESCFNDLKMELEDKNYEVDMDNGKTIDVDIHNDGIDININREFKIKKKKTKTIEKFNIKLINPIYNLAEIAIKVIDSESRYCNFNYVNHMLLYPRYDIIMTKTHGEDDIEIYTITDLESQKKFKFAVRGCVIPPGLK